MFFVAVDIGWCQQTVAHSRDAKVPQVIDKNAQLPDGTVAQTKEQLPATQSPFFTGEHPASAGEDTGPNATDRVIDRQRLVLGIVFSALVIAVFAWLRLRKLFQKVNLMNSRIAMQNDELAALNGIKTKVFSVIAHDLRNPLTQLVAVMQLIENQMLGPEELKMLIPSLNRSVYHTLHITDNLLMWAKSQMNGFRLKAEAVNLDELTREVLETLSLPLEAKKLSVDIGALQHLSAWGDIEILRIVTRNLLTNAIKFTPSGGRIRLSLAAEGDYVTMEISDSGIGMTAEQLQNLFSFDSKCTRGTENERGSGLGLKICADLLKINDGRISVKSEPGQGTTFSLFLQRHENEAVALPVAEKIFAGVGY